MSVASSPETLNALRDQARTLLNEFDAADGLACYYALHHDPARTTLITHLDASGTVDGFLARCQTGFDLFRPLVTLRVRGKEALPELIAQSLATGRPYILVAPEDLAGRLSALLTLEEPGHNLILRLDPARFRPEMNVLVDRKLSKDGQPIAEIRQADRAAAVAGVNWRSPVFAEVFVRVQPDLRGRGYGRAVVSAVVAELLKGGVTPLYSVAADNDASKELAARVGFIDTGAREVMTQATRKAL